MTLNTRMRLLATMLLAIGGSGACGFDDAASAGHLIDPTIYVLHGTGPFSRAVAVAFVTRLAPGRFRLSLTARRLPPPTILHVTFARHAYVAWLVHGAVMRGPLRMAAVGLAPTSERGTYAGQGTVILTGVTAVIVSAEPTAQAYMPIIPVLTILASTSPRIS